MNLKKIMFYLQYNFGVQTFKSKEVYFIEEPFEQVYSYKLEKLVEFSDDYFMCGMINNHYVISKISKDLYNALKEVEIEYFVASYLDERLFIVNPLNRNNILKMKKLK